MYRRKILSVLVYGIFLCFTTAACLEALARLGLPESDHYRTFSLIESYTARPRVLLLGDSFSIEGEGSCASRIRSLVEQGGGTFINTAQSGMGPEHYLSQARLYTPDFSPDLIQVNYGCSLVFTPPFSRLWSVGGTSSRKHPIVSIERGLVG